MTPKRWKEIEAVFEQALETPADQRSEFLHRRCDGDEALRHEVESLLESHASAGNLLERQSLFFSTEEFGDTGAILTAGELVGAYRVLRELGRGGMGTVYLAERADEQYDKRVAIKVIKRGMDTDSVLRHFRNERQILASFDHPNIARLFDGGATAQGLPYFVMEYVEGLPIDRYCRTRALPVVERLKLFLAVCAAVSYAHRHAVIHRDIKPSNILVTGDGAPKLLDFGVAKMLAPTAGAEALMTATGVRPMTPQYASPEQVRGEAVTTASDVYSLGIVLYELLTGELPYHFASQSPLELAREITTTEPKKPSTVVARANRDSKTENRKSVEGDLDNIVLMAIRKEPERRYRSVEQLAEDIQRHLDARPVLARRDTFGYRAAKFVQRNRALTVATVIILISLIAGIVASSWQAHRANIEKSRAERRFNDVRRLAHSVLFDYHDAIKALPGATRVRERLVKDALTYLDSLASEAAGDPSLQRELADAYERVGDVRGETYGAHTGDRAGAMDSYGKALRIRESLAATQPYDIQTRRQVAAIYRKIGDEMLETSEAPRGVELLQKSLALSTQLAAERPEDQSLRDDLAEIHNHLGRAMEDRGEMASALEHQKTALALREAAVAAAPGDAKRRRDLSVAYVDTGRALFFTSDVPGAIGVNQKALELRKALVAEDPTNADYRRLLAIAYQNNGDYHAFLGQTDAALQSFRNKLPLDEAAVAADPANAQAKRDLAYTSERLGVLLSELGRLVEALPHFETNFAVHEKIVAEDPQNLTAAYKLILAGGEVAQSEAKLGQSDAARRAALQSINRLKTTPDNPANAYLRGLRARACTYLGDTYRELAHQSHAQDDWRTARELFQQSLEIWQDLQNRKLLAADDAAKPHEAVRDVASCDAALEQRH